MPVLLPGVASLQFLGHSNGGQVSSNTIHIANPSSSSPPDFAELQNLADQMYSWLGTQYNAVGVTSWTFDSIIARSIPDPRDPGIAQEAAHFVGTAGTRAASANALPANICSLLFFQTPNASRRFRGHIFLPPAFNQSTVNGGALATGDAYWTASSALRDKLRAGYAISRSWTGSSLSNYNLVCYSRVAALASQPYVANVSFVGIRANAYYLRSRSRGTT